MKQGLLIFARFPEAGKCKTRLIPELGAEGAAELQARMTRHTLAWAQRLAKAQPVVLTVVFEGGDVSRMTAEFGDAFAYVPQVDGGLGDRLLAAVQESFEAGAERLIVVGTDCPELNEQLVATALARLGEHDVCIAPAEDGGYVLLGISRQSPARMVTLLDALFSAVPWGSSQVLPHTLEQLSAIDARLSLLPTLADVDVPADLSRGLNALHHEPRTAPRLSVVIPVWGNESGLGRAIASAGPDAGTEVILAAAGAGQAAARTAAAMRVQLVQAARGRGVQMDAAAAQASGEVLLFLHADSILPDGFAADISAALQDPQTLGGAFLLRIDSPRWAMRCIEWGVAWRSRWLQLPYGDQAIFVRKSAYAELGGFGTEPIMEDYDFVRRLKRRGKLCILSSCVATSARRWQRLGLWRTLCINQLMLAGFHLGVSRERLARFYTRRR